MLKPTLTGYFITGSDTDVGKTWVGCQIIQQLSSQVKSLKVRKPVESGCDSMNGNPLFPKDGDSLFRANGCRESLDIITPYRFNAALAPPRAALLENQIITLEQLTQAVKYNIEDEDTVVVEGAGGYYSPIAANSLNADLAKSLGLSTIIVIQDRLGAINQALLTINAVRNTGLKISALILNQTDDELVDDMNNMTDLAALIETPIYQCPFQGQLPEIKFD